MGQEVLTGWSERRLRCCIHKVVAVDRVLKFWLFFGLYCARLKFLMMMTIV